MAGRLPQQHRSSTRNSPGRESSARDTQAEGFSNLSQETVVRARLDPNALSAHEVIQLQRTIGNAAVSRLLAAPPPAGPPNAQRTAAIDPDAKSKERAPGPGKLVVGAAGDCYEQAAERMAEHVMRTPATQTATHAQTPASQGAFENIQREAQDPTGSFAPGAAFENQLAAAGGGRPMPGSTRKFMEGRFGADFSGVRLHTGSDAAQLNRAVSAQAFTRGPHIYFGQGKDNLASHEGKRLLAHELTHTIQQGGAAVQKQAAEPGGAASARSPLEIQRFPSGVIQRSLEYATLYRRDPNLAAEAVKVEGAKYRKDQKNFENQLGVTLFHNDGAKAGADVLLGKIYAALVAAGIKEPDAAFAVSAKAAEGETGAVLAKDVRVAMESGNLREKMGMVYQVIRGGQLTMALKTLRKQAERKVELGDEITDPRLDAQIEALDKNPKVQAYDYTALILKRRDSVTKQKREGVKAIPESQNMDPENLKARGVPLSAREEAASGVGAKKKLKWAPGKAFYKLPKETTQEAEDKLIRMVAGLSGSTDWYFHLARLLKLNAGQMKSLRLASLGQMLTNEDHSYHEIMHEARTQGGLTDYPDTLPYGYTTLDPYPGQQLLNLQGMPQEYPGDKQAAKYLHVEAGEQRGQAVLLPTRAQIEGAAGKPGRFQRSYRSTLESLDSYHQDKGSQTAPEAVVAKATAWLTKEDRSSDKRRPAIELLKNMGQEILHYKKLAKRELNEQGLANLVIPTTSDKLSDEYKKNVIGENKQKLSEMHAFREAKIENPYVVGSGGSKHARHEQFKDAWGSTPGAVKQEGGHLEDFDQDEKGLDLDAGAKGPNSLTKNEKLAIYGWTRSELYDSINGVVAGEAKDNDQLQTLEKVLSRGLKKLPSYHGKIYRGTANIQSIANAVEAVEAKSRAVGKTAEGKAAIQAESEKQVKLVERELLNRQFSSGGYQSHSKRAEVSYIYKVGKYVAWEVNVSKHAKDISAYSQNLGEREVLLLPRTKTTVTGVKNNIANYLAKGKTGGAVWLELNEK